MIPYDALWNVSVANMMKTISLAFAMVDESYSGKDFVSIHLIHSGSLYPVKEHS